MIIGVQNASTKVTDAEAYQMALALDWQLRHHVAPAWDRYPPQVMYLKSGEKITGLAAGDNVITIFDNSDQAGALGYHSEDASGIEYGRVFAETVFQNGGAALTGELSVCSVLSHEGCEFFGDQAANLWADVGNGTAIALELADPVESDSYPLTIGTGPDAFTASLSDFMLPAWFNPDAPAGSKFDWLDLVTAPFQVRSTGYAIELKEGSVSEIFGEHYPEWRKETKASELSRTSRRHKAYPRHHHGLKDLF